MMVAAGGWDPRPELRWKTRAFSAALHAGAGEEEGTVAEERLKLAVFVDFDNIQIGVKDTLGKDFDVSVVLEALKERGEVVTKIAYGDWHRAGDQSLQMTQHAVQLVQRNVTPRGDKNGADINLALDALEMAFTRHHINAFAIVGGDSDFITLVEKLKQYDKRVFVVGGRSFTSHILQRNCHEFIAYENLLKSGAPRSARRGGPSARASADSRTLSAALPNVRRALKILAEREVAPQLGLLKSTLLQLDPTFSERDYGAGSFLEFVQKMEQAHLVRLRKSDRSYLVELIEGDVEKNVAQLDVPAAGGHEAASGPALQVAEFPSPRSPERSAASSEAMGFLKLAVAGATAKAPNRPIYLRHIRQGLRAADKNFDERRYGFRGILDLLHQAQREGLVRLTRDRKGVWRIFPVSSTPSAPPPQAEPGAEPLPAASNDLTPTGTEAAQSAAFELQEVVQAESASPQGALPAIEQAIATEAPTERKARKPRAVTGSGKSAKRQTSAHRKPKGTAEV